MMKAAGQYWGAVSATMREFLGYDTEEKPALDSVPPGNADPIRDRDTLPPSTPQRSLASASPSPFAPAQTPKPLIRLRQSTAAAKVWDGQTLVLFGGSAFFERQDKGRWVRRPEPSTPGAASGLKKQLLVFVTPAIVDAAGNRLHSDDEFPERFRSVPPQVAPPTR